MVCPYYDRGIKIFWPVFRIEAGSGELSTVDSGPLGDVECGLLGVVDLAVRMSAATLSIADN